MESDGRKMDVGHVLQHPAGELEVTSVRYQENDEGVRHSFEYTLGHKEEIDAAREQARLEEERRQADEAAALEESETDETPTLG
jgi:hypothetical protein